MSTKYFILAKQHTDDTANDSRNQLMYPNTQTVYILPANNLSYYADHGLFEKALIDWCRQFCKNTSMLDIGAHTGTYSIALSMYTNKVHSFEPQKMTYYALCGSIALSDAKNVTAYNVALGAPDQVGTQTLNIRSQDGGGSSLQPFTDPVLAQEQVEVRTLDSYNFQNIGFIKMNVLKGAVQTIKQNNYPTILFESNHENKVLFEYILDTLGYGNIIPIKGMRNMFLTEPPKPQQKQKQQQQPVKLDDKSYYESLGIHQWT